MHIWIDIDNAPHVAIFAPIVRRLEQLGHACTVTVRDHAYAVELLDLEGLTYTCIGTYPGKQTYKKILGSLRRSVQLARFAIPRHPDIAVSHGSRSLVLAAWLARIPSVTMYDYEHVSTSLFRRFSTKILIPEAIPEQTVTAMKIPHNKLRRYPGFKEELYLHRLQLDPCIYHDLDVDPTKVLVVLRPPATTAHYHEPLSESLFEGVLKRILELPHVIAIVLPRTPAQYREIRTAFPNERIRVLEKPVNGLNLIFHADLVISGGGTMNREAALLGVPTYSIFTGRIGALDQQLVEQGRLHLIRTPRQIQHIKFKKRKSYILEPHVKTRGPALVEFVIQEILTPIPPRG